MKITDDRAYGILCWLDDQAGDHTHLFEQMTRYRDAAALIRQLRDAEQAAWHAGLDAGREQGRGKELAGAKDAETETLKAEVAAQRTRADAMAGEAIKHEARAERLAEALREAEKDLRQLSVIDCGCKPCRRACRTGKGAEWELESRMKTAHAAANKARAALLPTDAQENDDA